MTQTIFLISQNHPFQNGRVQMEEEEMENFLKLVDENGEISKDNLIIQVF